MQVNAVAQTQKGKNLFPPKPLIPPLGYSMLDEGLYRANGPFSKHNVAFLSQHAFKSVICLANDTIEKTTQGLIDELNMNVIYSRSLQLENFTISEAEIIICDVVTCLLDSSVYPVLFIGSSANFADLAVLGYIRRLQGISLVSIFWELELLAMKKDVDLEQFVERMEVGKFDLTGRLIKLNMDRTMLPLFISRLFPVDMPTPEQVLSASSDYSINVINESVDKHGALNGSVATIPADTATMLKPEATRKPELELESIISELLFSTGANSPCLPLVTRFSTYDPIVSLVDDKDEDD